MLLSSKEKSTGAYSHCSSTCIHFAEKFRAFRVLGRGPDTHKSSQQQGEANSRWRVGVLLVELLQETQVLPNPGV